MSDRARQLQEVADDLDAAKAKLPWRHQARLAIRTIVCALLDEAGALTGEHSFERSPHGPFCARCGGGADAHLKHDLAANVRSIR